MLWNEVYDSQQGIASLPQITHSGELMSKETQSSVLCQFISIGSIWSLLVSLCWKTICTTICNTCTFIKNFLSGVQQLKQTKHVPAWFCRRIARDLTRLYLLAMCMGVFPALSVVVIRFGLTLSWCRRSLIRSSRIICNTSYQY